MEKTANMLEKVPNLTKKEMEGMSIIDNLMHGSIDMHMHVGPDPRVERKLDAIEAARQAKEAGMRAIVLKCHEYPTAPLAYAVRQIINDIGVFGSLCLDLEIGGLNLRALQASAKLGAKVVWMPTRTAAACKHGKSLGKEALTILDEHGKLLPVVGAILDIIKKHRMVMATGHLSVTETAVLVAEARKQELTKIVITHPVPEQRNLVGKGTFFEFCIHSVLIGELSQKDICTEIKTLGVENCIISTDFGKVTNPFPVEGMRMSISNLLNFGMTEKEIEILVKVNAAKLLDLD
jgi:hypothetical protein